MNAIPAELASALFQLIGKMSEGEATSDDIDSAAEGLLPRIHDYLLRVSGVSENASDMVMEEGFSDVSALMVKTHVDACAEPSCCECERCDICTIPKWWFSGPSPASYEYKD